jgi:small-conductance mechanosensitive channel
VDIWQTIVISLVILLASAALLTSHVRTWKAMQAEPLEPEDHEYRRRQYRRRMQCSSMLGVLGFAIVAGRLMMLARTLPLVIFVYWTAVVLVVFWIGVLAVVDMLATKRHFARLREHCLIEQAKLQAELRRLQGNGHSGPSHRQRKLE